jgi:hypothetical protein
MIIAISNMVSRFRELDAVRAIEDESRLNYLSGRFDDCHPVNATQRHQKPLDQAAHTR